MLDRFQNFLRDENGGIAIEYALIGSLVSVAIYSAVSQIAPKLNAIFNNVTLTLK